MRRYHALTVLLAVALSWLSAPSRCAAELLVGAASGDITPAEPVIVTGQFGLRISKQVETPLTANALVLQSRGGDQSADMAIIVSCDVISIPVELLEQVRSRVAAQSTEIDTGKIFLSGTHTHTGPELRPGRWKVDDAKVMAVERYCEFFADRVAETIVRAWTARTPGAVTWGLSHGVVAYNRRAVYADGSAKMYGSTTVPEFRGLEGYEDHDIGSLFAWNDAGKLIAVAVNVSCPSQEVESRSALNADYWHPVRERLHGALGPDVCVLGWIGAAGDQSPHLMYRKAADERMRQLRGLSRLEEIGRRVANAVLDAFEAVKDQPQTNVPLIHKVEIVTLPMRLVTEAEYEEAKSEVQSALAQIENNPQTSDSVYRRMLWYKKTVDRFESQQQNPHPTMEMELHVVRIGDAVICTNQFELFTEFGIRIKARSKANQTFVIQLVGPGTYLPTARAVRGGHYSAVVHSSLAGPEAGQALVDRTAELIDSMWPDAQ